MIDSLGDTESPLIETVTGPYAVSYLEEERTHALGNEMKMLSVNKSAAIYDQRFAFFDLLIGNNV
jgi:hypothetical protein